MSPSPVLVFGATGFTGRMAVKQLVALGLPVLAAGRSAEKLDLLAEKFAVETVVADVEDPDGVAQAAARASVMLTTVGPYTRHGHVAAEAALSAGIPYIDVTGEPGWLRRVFDEYGPRAAELGVAMLPAIGYDYVPGNLAGAMALSRAGEAAVSIDIGYFLTGSNKRSKESFSGGTLDSLKESGKAMQFAFRDGALVDVPARDRVIAFDLDGHEVTAVSIGSTEHIFLPRFAPWLAEVNAGLGWFGGDADAGPEPGAESGADGPADAAREQARTNVIAVARGGDGAELARVRIDGPNPYDLTGLLTAWCAQQLAAGYVDGAGALGPVEAFGLDQLRDACAAVGLKEV